MHRLRPARPGADRLRRHRLCQLPAGCAVRHHKGRAQMDAGPYEEQLAHAAAGPGTAEMSCGPWVSSLSRTRWMCTLAPRGVTAVSVCVNSGPLLRTCSGPARHLLGRAFLLVLPLPGCAGGFT